MRTASEQTIREIAVANPAAARVFETLGIDYCCGGNLSLGVACANAKVPVEAVIGSLERCERPQELDGWNDAPLGDLTHYIVEQHHGFVRRESPRIYTLLTEVCDKHGRAHAELSEVRKSFAALEEELAEHMMKEERILFPYIEALENPTEPSPCFASVESPITTMIAEHELAGAIVAKIRAGTNQYKTPEAACPTFQELYQALEEFERDLHWHIHLENNILFPRAIATERERQSAHA
jgi:regulator of cell morphogenesis and NO signaling